MASFNIHLAVAKKYVSKNTINDEKAFYDGIIDPDLRENETRLHYTDEKRNKDDLISYLKGKANLSKFLSENEINTEYNKALFLHLTTDYLFFTDFFDVKYLENITYNDFVKDLYYSYDYTNNYLLNKYDIDLSDYKDKLEENIVSDKKEKNTDFEKGNNILDFDKLDKFIERVSNINLEKYKKKILETKS